MADKKCKQCTMIIPQEAKKCPYCRGKQGLGFFAKLFIGFILFIVFVAFMGSIGGNSGQTAPTQADTDDYLARVFAKKVIERTLKSPSTAKFQELSEFDVKKSGANLFSVSGYVDSQNGFGATGRAYFRVAAIKGKNDWQVSDLKITQ